MSVIEPVPLTKGVGGSLIGSSAEYNSSPLAVAWFPKTIVISLDQLCLVDYKFFYSWNTWRRTWFLEVLQSLTDATNSSEATVLRIFCCRKPTLDKAEDLSSPSKSVTQEFGRNIILLTAYLGEDEMCFLEPNFKCSCINTRQKCCKSQTPHALA